MLIYKEIHYPITIGLEKYLEEYSTVSRKKVESLANILDLVSRDAPSLLHECEALMAAHGNLLFKLTQYL